MSKRQECQRKESEVKEGSGRKKREVGLVVCLCVRGSL